MHKKGLSQEEKHDKKQINEILVLKSQLARALADYDNLSKRTERESAEMATRATSRVIKQLLPAFDMVFDATEHLSDPGLAMATAQIAESLKTLGVEQIKADAGMEFDEQLHEAVDSTEEGDYKKGVITSVSMAGWKFIDGPVIRHAKVIVKQ